MTDINKEQTRREVSLDAEQRAHEAGTTIAEFYEKKLTEVKAELEQAERKEIRLREALNGALSNQSEWWEKAEQALNYDGIQT